MLYDVCNITDYTSITSQNLTLKTTIEDVRGQSLPAIEVFSASIKALRDHLHEALTFMTIDIREDEIKWVLTVPAIWSDPGKKFMRKNAEKVSINKSLSRMSSPLLSI